MKKPILLFTLITLMTSCSFLNKLGGGPPDASEARKHFEKLNEKPINDGTFKITNFEKTNGVSQSNGEQYTLTWKSSIIYLKDAEIACCLRDSKLPAGGTIKAGETRDLDGIFIYFKTDNGYKMRDGNGRFIEPY